MLILGLNIGKDRYGINTSSVIEIIPLIELNKIPLVDHCIKGIFNYRGEPTPVIDLCQLFENRDCSKTLSSRIIIIKTKFHSNENRTIGLAAERITDVIRYEQSDIAHSEEKHQNDNHPEGHPGQIFQHNNEIIQLIETKNILPTSISQQLIEKLG